MTTLSGTAPPLLRRRWIQLMLIIVTNAVLQALLVLPSPWGTDARAVITAAGSLVVLIVAGVLAMRAIRRGAPSASLGTSIAHHPWRFIFAIFGTVLIAIVSWFIGLICIAFLPGPLAIAVAWLAIGALVCLPMTWFVRLKRLPV
jgi:hypothetical protein